MAENRAPGFINKRYTGLEEIGKGGMGVVYRARDTNLDRDVAVKVILPHFSSRPDFKESFEREAKALANLEHPNIIPIHDFYNTKRGAYYVMALMAGKTLQTIIGEGALDAERFLGIARSLLAALGYAHANNILHRDIKSANIFVGEDGHTFLGDFGVALPDSGTSSSSLASQQFHFQGTPAYASPEQIEGHRLTPASDIYSLGILFYEMLSGTLPFTGSLNNVLTGQLTRKPPRLDIDDPKLQHLPALIARMLDKSPGHRPQNTEEVRNLLDHPELVSPLEQEEMEADRETAAKEPEKKNLPPDQLALQLSDRIKLYRSRYNDSARLLKQLETSKGRIDKQMYRELRDKYAASLEENLGALEELFHQAETCITELELMLKHDQDALREEDGKKTELRFLREGNAISVEELEEKSAPIDSRIEEIQTRIEARSERLNRLIGSLEKHRVTRVVTPLEKALTWGAWIAAGAVGAFILYILFLSVTTTPGRVTATSARLYNKPLADATPVGRAWKDDLVSIFSVKRGHPGEVITIRKTFLQSGLRLIELERGSRLIITSTNRNTLTVEYSIPGKGTIRGATISRSSVRRNNWYRIKTAGGGGGWALAEEIMALRNSNILKRFVFNIQRMFGKRKKPPKSLAAGSPITGIVKGGKIWEQTGPQKDGKIPVRFTFHLDAKGAAAITTALTREIAQARLSGQQSLPNTLEEIKAAFSDSDYAAAKSMIAGFSVIGPFNSWNRTATMMKKSEKGGFTLFSTETAIHSLRTNEAFAFSVTLLQGDRKVQVTLSPGAGTSGEESRFGFESKTNKFPMLSVHVPTSVSASTEDPDNPVFNLIDDRTNSSWRSAPDKSGRDARLEFKFPSKKMIRQIGIRNGTGSGSEIFAFNRAARIQMAAGTKKTTLFFRDGISTEQRFTLSEPVSTDSIIFVIEEVFPGSQTKQAAITDVYFYY